MPPYKLNKQDLPDPRLTLNPDENMDDTSQGRDQAAPEMASTSGLNETPTTASSTVNQPADRQKISPNGRSPFEKPHAANPYTAYLNIAAAQWKHNYENRSPEQKARDVEHKRHVESIAAKQRKTAFGGNKIDFGPAKPKGTLKKPKPTPSQPHKASYIAEDVNIPGPEETLDDDFGDPELDWAIRESLAVSNTARNDSCPVSEESAFPQQRGHAKSNDITRSPYFTERTQQVDLGDDDMDVSMADSVTSLVYDTTPAVWIYDSNAEHDHPSPFLRPFEKEMVMNIDSHDSASSNVDDDSITDLNLSHEEIDNTIDKVQRTTDRQMTDDVSTPAPVVRYTTPEFKKPPPPRARARRVPWSDREKQACKLAMEWALIKCREVKVEDRWDHMSAYLADMFKVYRTGAAIKDQWNRYLRVEYNMDERVRKKPNRMVTCAQTSRAGDKRKLQQLDQGLSDCESASNTPTTFPATKVPKLGSQDTPKQADDVAMDATPQASTASTKNKPKNAQGKRFSLATPSALSRSAMTDNTATFSASARSVSSPTINTQRIRVQLLAAGQKVIDTFLTSTGKPIPSNVQDILQALITAYAPKFSGHSVAQDATTLSCISGNSSRGDRGGAKTPCKNVRGILVDEDGLPVSGRRSVWKKGGRGGAPQGGSLRDGYIGRGKSFLYE